MTKKNVNKMSIQEILREVSPLIVPKQLSFIAKNTEKMSEDVNSVYERGNDIKMIDFLIENASNIDKEKLVFVIAVNLKTCMLDDKEKRPFKVPQNMISKTKDADFYGKCLELLKGTKVQIPLIEEENGLLKMRRFITMDELCGRENKRDTDLMERNLQLIEHLEEENQMPLDIMLSICSLDEFEEFVCYNKSDAIFFQYLIIHNAKRRTVKEMQENAEKGIEEDEDKVKFKNLLNETSEIIKQYPEKFDVEKLLLLSAYHAKTVLEIKTDSKISNELYSRIMLEANRNIVNRTIKISGNAKRLANGTRKYMQYSVANLEEDIKRIVGDIYISKYKLKEMKEDILCGKSCLKEVKKKEIFNLLELTLKDKKKMIEVNSENLDSLIKFDAFNKAELRECIDEIDGIQFNENNAVYLLMRDILEKRDLVNVYMKNGLTLPEMININEMLGLEAEIKVEELMDYYFSAQEDCNKLKCFERYSLLFREAKIKGKTDEERQEIIDKVMEELYKKDTDYEKDLKNLYKYNLLPIHTLIDWNGEEMIYDLIKSNSLKSKDAKELLASGELSVVKAQDALINSELTDAEKMNFIFSSFDGNGKNEEEIEKQNNARLYLMQSINMSKEFKEVGEKSRKYHTKKNQSTTEKIKKNQYITDPVYRWQLLSEIDEECEQEVYSDGSVAFVLPNVNNGTVIIEKMYKFSNEGLKINYGSATYVMSQEEFYKKKQDIIQNNTVNRRFLIDMQQKNLADKLIHSSGWGKNLKKSLDISQEKDYDEDKINRIDNLISKIEKARELM